MTYSEARFRDHLLESGFASRTVSIYLATVNRALDLCEEHGWDLLELSAVGARALSDAWAPGRSSRSHLRAAIQHAWEAHGRLDGPGRAIRVPRKPPGRCRALEVADAAILAAAASTRDDHKGLAVLLALYAALRREEIARARWADESDGWLHVLGKGDRERDIPMHPALLEAWRRERAHNATPWVFPGRFAGQPGRLLRHATPASIWNWIREVATDVGLAVKPHELRHTALATAHDATGDLRATQTFAGHARPETTALYTRTTGTRLVALVNSIDYRQEEDPCPAS